VGTGWFQQGPVGVTIRNAFCEGVGGRSFVNCLILHDNKEFREVPHIRTDVFTCMCLLYLSITLLSDACAWCAGACDVFVSQILKEIVCQHWQPSVAAHPVVSTSTAPAAGGDTHISGDDADMSATTASCAAGFAILFASLSTVLKLFEQHREKDRARLTKPNFASYFDALRHFLSPESPEVTQLTPCVAQFCQVRRKMG
jgi:hypothetical protein